MSPRRSVLALALVVVLPVLAYAAFPWWSKPLLGALLNSFDVELLDAELERPGLQGLLIRHLALDYRLEGRELSLYGRNWQIGYSVSGLFTGRVDSLAAENLELVVTPVKESVETGQPLSLPLILPGDLLGQIPLDEFHIDRIFIRLPDAQLEELDGYLRYADNRLRLQLGASRPLPLKLELLVNQSNQLEFQLVHDGQSVAKINSLLQGTGDDLISQGELEINFESLAALLHQLSLMDSGFKVSGGMLVDWNGSVPSLIDAEHITAVAVAGRLRGNLDVTSASGLRCNSVLENRLEVRDGHLRLSQPDWRVEGTMPAKLLDGFPDPEKLLAFNGALSDVAVIELALTEPALRLLEGELAMSVRTQGDEQQKARLEVDSLRIGSSPDWRSALHFRLRADAAKFHYQNYLAGDVGLQGEGRIDWTSGQTRLEIESGFEVGASRLRHEDTRFEKIRFETHNALAFQLERSKLTLPHALIDLQTGAAQSGDVRYELKNAQLELNNLELDLQQPGKASATIKIRMDGLRAASGDLRLEPSSAVGSLNLIDNRLRGSFNLEDENKLFRIAGKLEHDLAKQTGHLDARLDPILFDLDTTWLPRLFTAWPYPFDLSGGKLEMSAGMQWTATQVLAESRIGLENLAGFYDRTLFHGLNADAQLVMKDGDFQVTALATTVSSLDVGFPVTRVRFDLKTGNGKMVVKDFAAELLGGEASQNSIEYDLMRNSADFDLQLANLQLEKILQLEQGISGRGTLSGHLPIRVRDAGLSIRGGEIHALPPGGYISYQHSLSPGALGNNAQLQLIMAVLQNFQFKSLDMMVDYEESGDLRLQTRLSGRNPNLVDTRPVDFNLNINENIPTLLKSLQLTQSLSDKIEKRINDFYQ